MNDFKTAMQKMEKEARAFVQAAGLDPDNMPDWDKQKEAFEAHFKALEPPPTTPLTPEEKKKVDRAREKKYEIIPGAIKNAFPENGIELGSLGADRARALGLKRVPTIKLSRGKKAKNGVSHNWKHHKEMFTDLVDSQEVLEETIGNPKARCVLSVESTDTGIKRTVVIHNPDTGAYCVLHMWKNDDVAQIVSWHRTDAGYGNSHWNQN